MNVKHVAGGIGAAALVVVAAVSGRGAAPVPATPTPAPGQTCFYHGFLPDPGCTPGTTDPRVSQENISATICVSGYTQTVRPPVSVTDRIKHEQMTAYGVGGQDPANFEEDHLISLEIGGAPADPHNLFPEPYAGNLGARTKDRVENRLHALVCAGQLPLVQAQTEIATDWVAAYERYVGPPP